MTKKAKRGGAAPASDKGLGRLRRQMLAGLATGRLLERLQAGENGPFEVILSLNELHPAGLDTARRQVTDYLAGLSLKTRTLSAYVLCRMGRKEIEATGAWHAKGGADGVSPLYRIWEDSPVELFASTALTSIKADAAHRSFAALGEGIVWAVVDSGIDGTHPHFKSSTRQWGEIRTLEVAAPLAHMDLTETGSDPLSDPLGHGTHVAGVIAGGWESAKKAGEKVAGVITLDEGGNDLKLSVSRLDSICGVAPLARLVSLKVVPDAKPGAVAEARVSFLLAALEQIQKWNEHGRRLRVHGVNLSLGYAFNPEWFACGQSPLCVEVNRLVMSGVVVVTAAGNGGYSNWINAGEQVQSSYTALTISDPGNAELAITTGATHSSMPHTYGVSYFSSRGPTGDGRLKPDLVAPGERILSCAAGLERERFPAGTLYCEQSGTSMAAPHVSGAVAAFLSARAEFIGQPQRVKQILLDSAIDLGRERYFQGHGLLDLLKALQSV